MEPDVDEIFTVTKQGMQCYADFFNYNYPFVKYDQIWVPVSIYLSTYDIIVYCSNIRICRYWKFFFMICSSYLVHLYIGNVSNIFLE